MQRREEVANFGGKAVLPQGKGYALAGVPVRLGRVGAVTIGTCFINTIQFIYPWNTETRVTSVPQGERFDFVVNYQAQNTVGGLTDQWSMCIVWWEDGGATLDGYYFGASSSTVKNQNYARIANNYTLIMPAHNVTLHFNMFINDDHNPSQLYPDRSVWATPRT